MVFYLFSYTEIWAPHIENPIVTPQHPILKKYNFQEVPE
jgi:hypothetical protein